MLHLMKSRYTPSNAKYHQCKDQAVKTNHKLGRDHLLPKVAISKNQMNFSKHHVLEYTSLYESN